MSQDSLGRVLSNEEPQICKKVAGSRREFLVQMLKESEILDSREDLGILDIVTGQGVQPGWPCFINQPSSFPGVYSEGKDFSDRPGV